MLAYIFGVVLFALAICVSIALHEAGHLLTAKAFGMKVRRYFIGFGPTLFSFRRGETEYGLKALPLGGFCDIAGMTALDKVSPDQAERAMWRYPAWKRTVVLSAGSITHFLVGFVVLYLMAAFMVMPNINGTPVLASVSDCVPRTPGSAQLGYSRCAPGDRAPAKDAGMQPGDIIVSINGEPISDYPHAVSLIQTLEGSNRIEVDRDGQIVPLTVDVLRLEWPNPDAASVESGEAPATIEFGAIGVTFATHYKHGPIEGISVTVKRVVDMFETTWRGLLGIPERIPPLVEATMGGERGQDSPVSVVGASRLGGEAVEAGLWRTFLMLLVSLNFVVGVFNLLPLLPLDGGHIAITWYERARDNIRQLRGKAPAGPVDYTRLSAVTTVIIVLGGAMVLLTVTADIVNPIRLFPH